MKILTMCRAGLVRSVALMDVLKLHFEVVDVLAVGGGDYQGGSFNSPETKQMLMAWADKIIVMEDKYSRFIPDEFQGKLMVCNVGPDRYGTPKHPELIDFCWRWCRDHKTELGIEEHIKSL